MLGIITLQNEESAVNLAFCGCNVYIEFKSGTRQFVRRGIGMRDLDECVAYFKQNDGFTRLMEGLYDLYVRYERCFGAVRLVRPTHEEEKAISDFFKRDYYNQALIRISLGDFERQVQKLFSPDVLLGPLLEAYTGKRILRRLGGARTASEFSLFVENELLPHYAGTEAEVWLRDVSGHARRSYRVWADRYNNDPKKVAVTIAAVCDALPSLPCKSGQITRFSDFAQKHALEGDASSLFLRALARKFEITCPTAPEDISALYHRAGLLFEGVLSQVTVRGLAAFQNETPDAVTEAYNRRAQPHILTLENLCGITHAEAYGGRAFIVENMTVFSAVNEQTHANPCTLICAGGGLNPALTRLLDLLSASGTALYYSGDVDYAGLCLADRIYLRYPKLFVPWRYAKSDYERILSESDFFSPDYKKDSGLHNEDLAALLSLMRKRGKTAPQSALIPDLIADLQHMA